MCSGSPKSEEGVATWRRHLDSGGHKRVRWEVLPLSRGGAGLQAPKQGNEGQGQSRSTCGRGQGVWSSSLTAVKGPPWSIRQERKNFEMDMG